MLAEGPAALMHRIVDTMVDNYRPEVEKLEQTPGPSWKREVFENPAPALVKQNTRFQDGTWPRCGGSCCRSATPWDGWRGESSP